MNKTIKIILLIACIAILPFLLICFAGLFKEILQFMADEPGNYVVVGIILALIFLITQLLLCYGVKRIWIRLIPLFVLILGFVLCLILFFGGFGRGSFFGEIILAVICASALSVASTGIGAAWGIWGLYKLIKRLKRNGEVK